MRKAGFLKSVLVTLVTLAGLSPGYAQIPKNIDLDNIGTRDINSGFKPLVPSVDEELALGRQMVREYEQSITLNNDPRLLHLVDRIAQMIARNSDAHIPIVVRVVESDSVNVSALPGGYLYVTTGLLRTASTEAELASALSFGVACVAARHAVETQGRSFLVTRLTPARSQAGIVSAALFVRKAVEESDFLGVQYLYKAGYDPSAAISLLQTVEALSSSAASVKSGQIVVLDTYAPVSSDRAASKIFSTHPPFKDRVARIEKVIARLPRRDQHMISSREFDEVHQNLSR